MDKSVSPEIKNGSGRYVYEDPDARTGSVVRIWYHRPSGFTADSPIVFVMHGVGRNADTYRDNWVASAETHGFLAIVPEYDREQFPGDWEYNLGRIATKEDDGLVFNEEEKWTFSIIDRVFAQVRDVTGSRRERFSLFGHSAGGQFVHRYMTFADSGCVDLAIAANAGWYTMPVREKAYPYGLGGTALTEESLTHFFARPLVLLLGEADTQKGENLRRTPSAMRQGPHRFGRGQTYFATGQREAERLGVPFNWRLETVPGVAHSNGELAGPAAAIIAASAPR